MARRKVISAVCLSLFGVLCTTIWLLGSAGDARIADAAKSGNKAEVLSLIKQAVDVNSAQGDGMTALHWAALNGDAEMAKSLIYAGANLKALTRLGAYTPLFMASQRGHAAVIDLLLQAGADPKVAAMDGLTPLMGAAMSGDAESVTLLLKHGADPDARESEHEQSPLSFAAAFNRADAIQILLQHGASPNLASKVLPPAESRPNPEAIPAAKTAAAPAPPAPAAGATAAKNAAPPAGKDPAAAANAQAEGGEKGGHNPRGGLTPLMFAAREGGLESVRSLLDGGADINAKSADRSTPLLLATINGHFDVAEYLVSRNADVNIPSLDGITPLYAVVNTQWARKSMYPQPTTKYEKTSYLDLMKDMFDHGSDPNAKLVKDLWYSEYNFSLESASATGTTAFWKCAEVGDVEGMRLLISRGADPSVASKDGVTPLLIAAGAGVHGNDDVSTPYGRLAGVAYLVEELHADVNGTDVGVNMDPYRTLSAAQNVAAPVPAAAPGSSVSATAQAAAKPPAAASQDGGFSALHHAAARGDNAMILYLVSHGARVNAVSKSGMTAADMANGPRQRIQPYPETVALLEMLGSTNNHKCVSC